VRRRRNRLPAVIAGAAVLAFVSTSALPAACTARSGAERATTIELFTSEGCSSCPPADRWLSGFAAKTPAAVIPLAFHVDYWDYIGWRDRFAAPQYTARQQQRVASNRGSFAYTPQVLINGRIVDAWRALRVPGEMAPAATPGADLVLRVETRADGKIAVDLDTQVRKAADARPAVAYLALFENGLSSSVRAGENAGRQLRHDFVVREWIGPLPVGGGATSSHVFARADVVAANAGIAALVESADGTRLLQAVAQPLCRGAGS
jgi:hypothetical protein